MAFRVIAGGTHPDHTVISEFRRVNLEALSGLFLQVLRLCQKAGLVKLGHVALDGTKLKANASKHKAMSYERMLKTEAELKEQVAALLEKAERVDQAEDREYGVGKKAEELPEELRRRQKRWAAVREARSALEAEAAAARALEKKEQADRAAQKAEESKQPRQQALSEKRREEAEAAATAALQKTQQRTQASAQRAEEAARQSQTPEEKRQARREAEAHVAAQVAQERLEAQLKGQAPILPEHRVQTDKDGAPQLKAQRNFTDPDSRIMVSGGAFQQAYNCQAVVDDAHQIIVAQAVSNQAPDAEYLKPLLGQVKANCGAVPEKLSADAGYWSTDNDLYCVEQGIDPYIAVGRDKHHTEASAVEDDGIKEEDERRRRMREKLRTPQGHAVYSRRKAIVEPVHGQTKGARGLRELLLRGLSKARGEYALICTTHNLLKLFRSGGQPAALQAAST